MSIRLSVLTLTVLALGHTPARADLIQLSTVLPPPNGAYSLSGSVCTFPVCLANIFASGFQITSDIFSAGNELVETTAILAADVFQNNGGSPGAPLGSLAMPGVMGFTYFGRATPGQLGTFATQITDFDFAGTFNGHTIAARRNPGQPSSGQTTITEVSEGVYQVGSFFDVFGEVSLDGGPFAPGPERHFTLTETPEAVPEPGSIGLVLFGLAGLAGAARRARTRRAADASRDRG